MNCPVCTEALTEESRSMDMTCCATTCHTACYFQKMRVDIYYDHTTVICPFCPNISFLENPHQPEHNEVAPITETPELRAAIKKVKKAIAAKNKGLRAATSAIATAHAAFKAQADPLIASIKAMKHEAMLTAKLSEGYREGVRTQRSENVLYNKLRKDFSLSYNDERALGLVRRRRRLWTTPCRLLRRKFRLRF